MANRAAGLSKTALWPAGRVEPPLRLVAGTAIAQTPVVEASVSQSALPLPQSPVAQTIVPRPQASRDLLGRMPLSQAPDLGWAKVVQRSAAPIPPQEVVADIQPQETTFAAILFRLIPTPRCGRLFAGVYRQLKARIPAEAMPRFEGSDGSSGEYQVPMLLLAIRIGASAAAERLFPALQAAIAVARDVRGLLRDCAAIAPELASLTMVEQIIRPIVADPAFPVEAALFGLWLPRIERYAFDRTGAPRCNWMPPTERVRPGSAGQQSLQ